MFESLHNIYPLLLAAGVALAFVPLIARQYEAEGTPTITRIFNDSAVNLASFFSLIGALLVLWYVLQTNHEWLIGSSFILILAAYSLLVIAFIVPFVVTIIHPWWRALYYRRFEKVQARDLKKVQSKEETPN